MFEHFAAVSVKETAELTQSTIAQYWLAKVIRIVRIVRVYTIRTIGKPSFYCRHLTPHRHIHPLCSDSTQTSRVDSAMLVPPRGRVVRVLACDP